MKLLRFLSCICIASMFLGVSELSVSAAMRIIPGYYEDYTKYLQREVTGHEEIVIKEDVKEVTYNPDNLREKSNLSKEQIYNILEGNNLQELADEYYEMEQKYNVNAIFLMALNMEESGHGSSSLAVNNNNLGGIKSRYGGYASFDSWASCLEYIASLIDEMYLTETGAYYNGTSIYGVNVKYCIGGNWAENLNTIANELISKVEPNINTNNIKIHNF
ncbi:glucosaminidase domain-containing protein [Clostridium sp. NSJ-6]|uniref:Glucosaminidase domain-containing protein n=1 Tax=Clostridium hominis TaxID=2763036 RepID=A0ABR7D9L7_9CLOT|nr:glucosaminidase domain-containing protein [Clostridium hominis]MDU2673143.1 glucosaminidase domain-containing protein [Clostridium sp.]